MCFFIYPSFHVDLTGSWLDTLSGGGEGFVFFDVLSFFHFFFFFFQRWLTFLNNLYALSQFLQYSPYKDHPLPSIYHLLPPPPVLRTHLINILVSLSEDGQPCWQLSLPPRFFKSTVGYKVQGSNSPSLSVPRTVYSAILY